MLSNNDLKKNGSGYYDPTAYEAIKRTDRENIERFDKYLHTIFMISELAGYHIEERIVVKDLHTGKVWR